MFIIWGTKGFRRLMGTSNYVGECNHCHNHVMYEVVIYGKKFSLFWIPLFTISRKYFLGCPVCQYGYDITKEQAQEYLAEEQ